MNYPTEEQINSIKDESRFSAWDYLNSLKKYYGGEKVVHELYIWYTHDAKTLSFADAGQTRLLKRSEVFAIYVLWNVHRHLNGEGIPWNEFVKGTRGWC